jgi:hypothetical protein
MAWSNHRSELGGAHAGGPLLRETGSGPVTISARPDSTLPPVLLQPPPSNEVHFTVRYALSEYCNFMWQHGAYLIRRRRVGRMAGWWLLSKSTSAAAMHFVVQGRSRQLYEFTIDDHGIIRATPSGVTLVPWSDVSAIRRYTCGYILVLARGTLPLPFRCLSAVDIAAMDLFAANLRQAARRG